MADDVPSAAQALYPHLRSEAASAPEPAPRVPSGPVPEPKGGPDRSLAEKIYGADGPGDGAETALKVIDGGKAKTGAEAEAVSAEAGEFGAAPHLVAEFREMAKEVGLSPARSEAMMKLHEKAMVDASTSYWEATGKQWAAQTRQAFPGAQLDAAVGPVKALLADRTLTTPGFIRLLTAYRLGDNPDIVRTLVAWSRAIGNARRR